MLTHFPHILLKPLCSSQARTSSGRDFLVSAGADGVSCGSWGEVYDCERVTQINVTYVSHVYVQVWPPAVEAEACCWGRNRPVLSDSSPSTTA